MRFVSWGQRGVLNLSHFLFWGAAILLAHEAAHASPQILRIDGSIFNASGAPITGNRDIQIKAYDASSGGSAVWTSSVYNTAVASGRFTVALDATVDTVALTDRLAAKAANGEIWFEIIYDTGTANGTMDSPVTMGTRIRGKGTMFALSAAKADALTGVTTSMLELNRLAGVTAGVQSQINALLSGGGASSKVDKAGDTMTGHLNLANQKELRFSEASGSGTNFVAIKAPATLAADLTWTLPDVDGGNNQLMKFNATTKTFFWDNDAGAAGGVTNGSGTSTDNALTRWDGGGGTGIQSSNVILSDSDTMSGLVGLTTGSANVTSLTGSRVVVTDGVKNLVSATNIDTTELDALNGVTSNLGDKVNLFTNAEAGYLSGVTSNIGAKLNRFSSAEGSYLAGVTSGLQSQIDAAFSAIASSPSATGRIARTGDTMSGTLGLAGANTTPDRVAYLNANRELVTSTVVSSAELDFIDGVTSNAGSKLNLFTANEAGRLAGVTSGIQSQIDSAFSAISSIPSATNRVAKVGDTMTGGLGFQYAGVTPNRVAYIDANRQLMTSNTVTNTELDFLSGVTSNLGARVNLFTNAEAGYLAGVTTNIGSKINLVSAAEMGRLAGVTSGIQSQIDAAFSAIASSPSATGRIARTGDTMSGTLGLAGANTTPDRVAYLNANRELVTSTLVSSVELDFIDGVTSNVGSKLNLFTANEAGRLAGVTSGIQSQIDSAFSAINSIPSATNRVAKVGDTMTGGLGFQYAGVTPSRVAYIDANRQLMTSNTVTNAELDFLVASPRTSAPK